MNTYDEKLTEAFHTVFDIKDDAPRMRGGDPKSNDDVRQQATRVLKELGSLMRTMGFTVPMRSDGDGR